MSVAIFKGKLVKFLAKAGILVPARGDIDRSGTPTAGEMAFNTTANKLEVYDGTGWTQLGGGSGNGLVHPTTGSTFELNANNLAMTGTNNTAIGVDSGKFITSGSYNVSIGKESLRNCNTGESNTTVGYGAGRSISIGSRNTLVGNSSGYSSTNQESNTYIGDNSGVVSSGSFNTALGANSFRFSTQVQYSTAVGYQSLARLSASGSGYYNIGIGYDSGWRLTGGQYNTFIASTGGTSDIVADGCVAIGTDGFGNSSQLNNGDFNAFVLGTVNHRYRLPGRVGTVVQIGPNGTSAGQTGTLRLFELEANGTNSISVRAPDEIATDVTLTLPTTAGSANQVLTTNGSGTLSWTTTIPATLENGAYKVVNGVYNPTTDSVSGVVDANLGNSFRDTNTGSRTIAIHNLKDGQSVNIMVQGAVNNVITITAFSDAGITSVPVKYGAGQSGTMASTYSLFTVYRIGGAFNFATVGPVHGIT